MSTLMNSRQRLLLALLILLVDYSTAAAIPSLPEHIPPAANPHTVNEPSEAYQHWRPYKEDTPWYVNFTWTNIFVMIFCSWGWCLSRCILVRVEGLARMRASQAEDEASCRRKAEDPEAPEPERSEMTRSVDGSASFQARAMINSAAGEGPSNIDGTFDSTAVLPARFLLVPAGVVKTCSPTDILTPGPSGPPLGKQNGYFNDWMDESARERIAEQRSHAARIRAREMEVDEDGTNLQLMSPKPVPEYGFNVPSEFSLEFATPGTEQQDSDVPSIRVDAPLEAVLIGGAGDTSPVRRRSW